MMKNTIYHKILRVSMAVCAVVLVFESGLISQSTEDISRNTHMYMANAVGMSASVNPTELNKITAALTERKRDLDVREAALLDREIKVEVAGGELGSDSITYILASILFILLVLILLNYVLDYLRLRERSILKPV